MWRHEGLRRPVRTGNADAGSPTDTHERLRRVRTSEPVWACDFQFDQTTRRPRRLKSLHVVDERSREALAMRRRTQPRTSDQVVAIFTGLVGPRGAPEHLRFDNGPGDAAPTRSPTAAAPPVPDRDLHRPGSPWENPFVESFNGRVRDELFNVERFASLLEAKVVSNAGESTTTPTAALLPRSLTPAEYAATWTTPQPQPALS